MSDETISQKFKLKRADEPRNYFIEEIDLLLHLREFVFCLGLEISKRTHCRNV